ncbi:uromodulin-like [Salarias fasciatus]|uniref:uromodulin-like n=1 Tax=Salarias fasciatus TaxID=181472 RepID=UPI0011767AC0|nr:uromodulin-like [Salarias fasciatus]
MDCILHNGTPHCVDPCDDYTVLNDEWRSTSLSGNGVRCDRDINWQGWYRMFQGQTSARIPERCIGPNRCGTQAPLYLAEPHPTQSGVIVNRTVCNSWDGSCCKFPNHQIQVKRCSGGFYVYKLVAPSTCNLAYCSGMDCILHHGTPHCADPCDDYTVLNDEWRSTSLSGNGVRCDRDINWQGWYRMFQGQTSARIPERCIGPNRCGTQAPLYLAEPHPTQSGVIVSRTVCNSWDGNCCKFPNHQIQVKRCSGGFYVYKLVAPSTCNLAYCSGNALIKTSSHREKGGISGLGSRASVAMSLYRSPAFSDTYPPGLVTLPVDSALYVGVSVENRGPDFAVILEDCFASHSLSPQSPEKYPLIQNRCPVDPRQVEVIENGRSTRARFSALFFLPNGKHEDVYLHCNLTLCDMRKYSCFTVSLKFHFISIRICPSV